VDAISRKLPDHELKKKGMVWVRFKSQYIFFHPNIKKKSGKGTFNGMTYYEVKKSFHEALDFTVIQGGWR
jgi:hypothetical protein